MGIVLTTVVASRSPRGLAPGAFRRLATAIARGGSLGGALLAALDGDERDDFLVDRVLDAVARPRTWVVAPFAVIAGEGASRLAAFDVDASGLPVAPTGCARTWAGSDVTALDRALSAALPRRTDVVAWYAALDHRSAGSPIDGAPGGECRVTLRRSTEPASHLTTSAYDDEAGGAAERSPATTTWLEVTGKWAPEGDALLRSPLGVRLRSALGQPWVGTSYA